MRLLRVSIAVAASAQMALAGLPALAQIPPGLSDLIGARAGQGELELQRRGYEAVRTEEGRTAKFTYWQRGSECVQVTTRDGRYLTMTQAASSFCPSRSSGSGAATAAVAGLAIIGLAAALAAHNRDHKDAGREHDAEFDRGYQAGLYGSNYDDRHETEGYHDGFIAGETERDNRRYANTRWVRGAPQAAQDACARRADAFQNRPSGSSVAISMRELGAGDYEMTMGTGPYRSRCIVSATGVVRSINPY